jgi:hypothetical protein
MKTIALTLIAAAIGFGQTTPSQTGTPAGQSQSSGQKAKTSAPQKPKPAPKANPAIVTIPPGATLVEPNLYRQTDSTGKTWMYRQTPFGISKWEDIPAAPQPPAAASEPVVVTDLGDRVRFEKKTAFGVSRWVRKKTELTDDEKALVAADQGVAGDQADKPAAAQSKKKIAEKQ